MTRGTAPGVVPTQSAEALVSAVPQLTEVADVEALSFRQIPGAHLTLDDVVELAALLARSADDYDGFVVTQGTDTLEETACVLDLLWHAEAPVVVTGAMRNPTVAGTDGPGNLLAAVVVAGAQDTRGSGCLVVLGDQIHAARLVQKRHTTQPSAFQSAGGGPVGAVTESTAQLWANPRRVLLPGTPSLPVPPVALLRMALGDDGRLIAAVAGHGYRGLVMEAFGGGHVSPAVADALGDLAETIPVVLASRTGAGAMLRGTYGFPGSEIDLLDRGLIPAGSWDGLKARILLSLALAAGADTDQIRAVFEAG